MSKTYRLSPQLKSSYNNVIFSQSVQDKLSEFVWGRLILNDIDARWKICGTMQNGVTEKALNALDYLPAFTSIPLFSQKLVDILTSNDSHDIDFTPCRVITDEKNEHEFFIARTRKFLPLINIVETNNGEAVSPLAPIIFNNIDEDFLLARDTTRKTMLVASEKFKDLCQRSKLKINFIETETTLDNWMKRQATPKPTSSAPALPWADPLPTAKKST